jgi:hypothetical protein
MKWSKVALTRGSTVPLSGHTANTIGNSIYFFGGRSEPSFSNDIYRYDFTAGSLEKVDCKGVKPVARSGHTSTPRQVGTNVNELFVFGGASAASGISNEVFVFDIRTFLLGMPLNFAFLMLCGFFFFQETTLGGKKRRLVLLPQLGFSTPPRHTRIT